MSVAITYFVHGTTTDNEQNISSGWNDVKLSELGITQSHELKKTLQDQQFDCVYHSDLIRAIDSAKLVFGSRAIPFFEDKRLRECNYGDLTASSSEKVEPMYEECIDTPFPNGESLREVEKRILSLLVEVKSNFDSKKVAFVAHKAPQLALDVLLSGMSWKDAIKNDWRHTKSWQPGWEYVLE